jgi:hypothetical protein
MEKSSAEKKKKKTGDGTKSKSKTRAVSKKPAAGKEDNHGSPGNDKDSIVGFQS